MDVEETRFASPLENKGGLHITAIFLQLVASCKEKKHALLKATEF